VISSKRLNHFYEGLICDDCGGVYYSEIQESSLLHQVHDLVLRKSWAAPGIDLTFLVMFAQCIYIYIYSGGRHHSHQDCSESRFPPDLPNTPCILAILQLSLKWKLHEYSAVYYQKCPLSEMPYAYTHIMCAKYDFHSGRSCNLIAFLTLALFPMQCLSLKYNAASFKKPVDAQTINASLFSITAEYSILVSKNGGCL